MPESGNPGDLTCETWLVDAVLDTIARYSKPHEKVLLLVGHTGESDRGRIAALKEAAESASRLDKTVQLRTVDGLQDLRTSWAGQTSNPESVCGSMRPSPDLKLMHLLDYRTQTRQTGPRATVPEPFDSIIACLDAQSADWLSLVAWAELLRLARQFVFIAFNCDGDVAGQGFSDFLTRIAGGAGLVELDQIALPEAPHGLVGKGCLFVRPLPPSREEQ